MNWEAIAAEEFARTGCDADTSLASMHREMEKIAGLLDGAARLGARAAVGGGEMLGRAGMKWGTRVGEWGAKEGAGGLRQSIGWLGGQAGRGVAGAGSLVSRGGARLAEGVSQRAAVAAQRATAEAAAVTPLASKQAKRSVMWTEQAGKMPSSVPVQNRALAERSKYYDLAGKEGARLQSASVLGNRAEQFEALGARGRMNVGVQGAFARGPVPRAPTPVAPPVGAAKGSVTPLATPKAPPKVTVTDNRALATPPATSPAAAPRPGPATPPGTPSVPVTPKADPSVAEAMRKSMAPTMPGTFQLPMPAPPAAAAPAGFGAQAKKWWGERAPWQQHAMVGAGAIGGYSMLTGGGGGTPRTINHY